MKSKEKLFFDTLRDVFVGAKVEGKGGFINLMKIKSNYYQKIEKILKDDIDKAVVKYPNFRDELFDKLYTFFSRYFSENGSIYFNSTPFHNNIYEKVYTDRKDIVLFWKTNMLYYVKTDRIFRSMPVEFDGLRFFFDASKVEPKKANEKKEVVYSLIEVKEDGEVVFEVGYSENGKKTNEDEILKQLKKHGVEISSQQLERAFRVFEKQSQVDFFINKNAKQFLREQFKLWMYQYFFEGINVWTAERIDQLQILRDIAYKIIDFVSQFEDELVKIWNKPKFVLNSNYVVTLDRIAAREGGFDVLEKILKHQNISKQIEEWKELGFVGDDFRVEDIVVEDLAGKRLADSYKFLPVDTVYFKDLEFDILGLFDELDSELDGWLIHSENYQALNTILPKFKGRVQTVYIDPPFNKEQEADYFYMVNYKDSTWATMLENRLRLARELMADSGAIFVRCDYNGNWIVRPLMDEIFGEENFRNEIVVNRISKQDPKARKFNVLTDTCFFYSKTGNHKFYTLFTENKNSKGERWHSMDSQGQGKGIRIFGYYFEPPKGRHWTYSEDKVVLMEQNKKIRIVCRICGYKHIEGKWEGCPECGNVEQVRVEYLLDDRNHKQIGNNWTDITGYSSTTSFPTENSEILLKRVIESTSDEGDLVVDFFLGSGTTTAVAHKLGRKWIGIEMGQHFYTVILPRMKKVLFYDKSGISKEKDVKDRYNKNKAGGFFKYYQLEQYEQTLSNTVYENHDMLIVANKNPYEQYIFLKDEKMLQALEIDYQNNKVSINLSKLYPEIDLPETLSNLLGKPIRKITPDYVEFTDGEKINVNEIDYKIIKPLIWWQ